MALIHHTTLKPTKVELLTSWLPTRPWYVGGPAEPELTKAGGFRLDDPAGEVGIEFMVATDTSGPAPVHYLAPLTYRGAPLDGADHALIGTMEHGVLGQRWAYDGCHDPVLITQLLALFEGRAEAQAQSLTDTPDHEVTHSYKGPALPDLPTTAAAEDDENGTELSVQPATALRLNRVLHPAPDGPIDLPEGATGQVIGHWTLPDSTSAHAPFAVLHTGPRL
ncbi:maltokinase N-terminal cap-like domain-containing protein [Streptomyces sp. NPDC002845]